MFSLPFRSIEVLQLTSVQADSAWTIAMCRQCTDHVQNMYRQIMYGKLEGPKITKDVVIQVRILLMPFLSTDKTFLLDLPVALPIDTAGGWTGNASGLVNQPFHSKDRRAQGHI